MLDQFDRKIATSRHLEGISDLTVAAPIKQGFVPAFETITYEGRLRLVMKALFRLRSAAREYEKLKPFADSAERIQSLRSFRLGVLPGNPSTLLLAATFDRAWEPYMRLIWKPLGPMLDVIFCNCEGYVTARDHSFAAYADWVRRHQVDTDFFYASTGLSVTDFSYLSKAERLAREGGDDVEAELTRIVAVDPTKAAEEVRKQHARESTLLAVDVLRAMYRLADFYPHDRRGDHGKYLIRATRGLLGDDWKTEVLKGTVFHDKLEKEIKWFNTRIDDDYAMIGDAAPGPDPSEVQVGIMAPYDSAENPVNHGCLMLMQVKDAARARAFIGGLRISWEDGENPEGGIFVNLAFTRRGLAEIGVPADELGKLPKEFEEGMEARAGLLGDVYDHHPRRWRLPKRWRPAADMIQIESPADRVEVVGADQRAIPLVRAESSGLVDAAGAASPAPPAAKTDVELSEVDLVIQLRTRSNYPGHEVNGDPDHPLYRRVIELSADPERTGVRLLAVETMRRTSFDKGHMRDHFGFIDGLSQPAAKDIAVPAIIGRPAIGGPRGTRHAVAPGELLWGYGNERTDPAPPPNRYFDNGSFLVVRKIKQDPVALDEFTSTAVQDMKKQAEAAQAMRQAKAPGTVVPPIVAPTADELLAYMMGRDRAGQPLVEGGSVEDNEFDFSRDEKGERCPLRAHIRRTNPRQPPFEGRNGPRIMRRGMSYGPPLGNAPDDAERGLVFMCYNASIAEQYEVIQRWLNGANPTGIASSQNDPLTGVGTPGDPRTFSFLHHGQVYRVQLDRAEPGARRFVRLEWGLYLFAPSRSAIALIARDPVAPAVDEQIQRGEAVIARLQQLEADGRVREAALGWKASLEDFLARDPALLDEGPAVWAAIRARGGVMRVPYGDLPAAGAAGEEAAAPKRVVLVGSRALVEQVYADPLGRYSVAKHGADRMPKCFGRIYIGRDRDDPRYYAESEKTNDAIGQVTEGQAFAVARRVSDLAISGIFEFFAKNFAQQHGKVDLRDQFITPVLAQLCRIWFGLPDGPDLDSEDKEQALADKPCMLGGGWDWRSPDERLPRCPGDFMAPSRYLFYPDPLPAMAKYGQDQGQRLHEQLVEYFRRLAARGGAPEPTTLTRAMFDDPNLNHDPRLLAASLIGVMTGFLPPTDGNLRLALFGWLEERDLWRVQQALVTWPSPDRYERAREGLRPALIRAMRKRPAPDMVLRTATVDHELGGLAIRKGEEIFVGITGATQENLDKGDEDAVSAVFGGRREGSHHPTHACPAYEFAMGTMLGMLSALFERCRIEALPSPLKVVIHDLAPPPPAAVGNQGDPEAAVGVSPAPAPSD